MCSDGFSTEPLPQKIDGNAFQATFGSGVLNEMSSAATPTGLRSVSTVRCGMRRGRRPPVRAASLAGDEEPHLDRRVDLALRELRAACPSRRRRARSPRRDGRAAARRSRGRRSPRSTGVRSAQSGCAARAAATAAAASSAPERATRQRCSPSAGRSFSSHVAARGRPLLACDEVRHLARGSPGRPAAVDDEVRAGHVGRRVRGEEDDRADGLRDVHQPAERRSRRERLDERAGWPFSIPCGVSVLTRTPLAPQ